MALEDMSSKTLNFYAPRYQVEIENKKLEANVSKAIIDLTIDEKIDEGANFKLTLHDEFDMNTKEFKWADHELFTVGNKITIKIGYGSDLHPMIMGNITGLEPSFFAGETPTLTIEGQDLSYDYMKRKSPERTFKEMTYSDIARTVADEAGLNPVVDDTDLDAPLLRKNNNESFFAFLDRLKERIGYQFKIDGQSLYFIKPRDEETEMLTLALGKDIISFKPTLKTTGLLTEVEVRGTNPRDPSKPIIGKAQAGSERTQEKGKKTASQIAKERHGDQKKVITNISVNSEKHANAIAEAELNKASDTFLGGEVECIGIPQIRTGVSIKLEKMGTRFSGKYYVKATTHTLNSSGYKTRFSVKRNAL
jgi:phage protein D